MVPRTTTSNNRKEPVVISNCRNMLSRTEILARLKNEDTRFRTFLPSWPSHNDFLAPRDLARAGFYYYNDGDKVQCAFCLGIIGQWERGDEPRAEHSRHFPRCPFVLGLPVGNVPSTASASDDGQQLPPATGPFYLTGPRPQQQQLSSLSSPIFRRGFGDDVTGWQRAQVRPDSAPERGLPPGFGGDLVHRLPGNQHKPMEVFGIQPVTEPRHPEYKLLSNRLKTFSDLKWPNGLRQRPKELAEAGFFYTGSSDLVRCYHCHVGLQSWAPEDDPWFEHSMWKPDCQFLILTKGADFIQQARKASVKAKWNEAKNKPEYQTLVNELGIDPKKIRHLVVKYYLEQKPIPSSIEEFVQRLEELEGANELLDLALVELDDEDPLALGACAAPSAAPKSQKTGVAGVKAADADAVASRPAAGDEMETDDDSSRASQTVVCKVCLDSEVQVVFLPCGHLCACSNCAASISKCPMCRKPINAFVRAFLS